jgi:hypothetical protein
LVLECATVLAGWHSDAVSEVVAEVGFPTESAEFGDSGQRLVGGLEQGSSFEQSLGQQPFERRHACGFAETSDQGPGSQMLAIGQFRDRARAVEVRGRPLQQRREVSVLVTREWRVDVLSLPASAVRGDDQPPGKKVGDLGPVI